MKIFEERFNFKQEPEVSTTDIEITEEFIEASRSIIEWNISNEWEGNDIKNIPPKISKESRQLFFNQLLNNK